MHHSNQVKLYREVNKRVRYYKLSILLNLFGEYIFIKEYGSIKAKRATRTIEEYFCTLEAAINAYNQTLAKKLSRGYTKEKERLQCNI